VTWGGWGKHKMDAMHLGNVWMVPSLGKAYVREIDALFNKLLLQHN